MNLSGKRKPPLTLDFYEGAYGPTIRIDIQEKSWLVWFQDQIIHISKSPGKTLDLIKNENVEATGINQLVLENTFDEEPGKSLTLLNRGFGGNEFRWTLSSRGWDDCAALIEGLLDAPQPGHQYLTDEESDDALIELAYKE